MDKREQIGEIKYWIMNYIDINIYYLHKINDCFLVNLCNLYIPGLYKTWSRLWSGMSHVVDVATAKPEVTLSTPGHALLYFIMG